VAARKKKKKGLGTRIILQIIPPFIYFLPLSLASYFYHFSIMPPNLLIYQWINSVIR
jgi:hypothetical protein